MNEMKLYIVTDGTDIAADADSEAAMERWRDEIGGDENLRSFCITIQVPKPPEITVTLQEGQPAVTLA